MCRDRIVWRFCLDNFFFGGVDVHDLQPRLRISVMGRGDNSTPTSLPFCFFKHAFCSVKLDLLMPIYYNVLNHALV